MRQVVLVLMIGWSAVCGWAVAQRTESDDSVNSLVARLESPDFKVRIASIIALGERGEEARAALPALFDQLAHPEKSRDAEPALATETAAAIVAIGPESTGAVLDILFRGLADGSEFVRSRAAAGFEKLGDRASERLWKSLSDAKAPRGLKLEVIKILDERYPFNWTSSPHDFGDLKPVVESTIPALRAFVREKDPHTSRRAIRLLASVGSDEGLAELFVTALRLPGTLPRSEQNIGRALTPGMIPRLVQELNDPDPEIRAQLLEYAAWAAREYRSWRTYRSVKTAEARSTAMRAKVLAVLSIVPHLNDADARVRWRAARILGEFGVEPATVVPALLKMIRTDRGRTRLESTLFYEAWAPTRYFAWGQFSRPISQEGYEVRFAAILALGDLGTNAAGAVPDLVTILRAEKSGRALWFAATALGRIGPAAKDAVPTLIEVLHSQEIAEPDLRPSQPGDAGPIPIRLAAAVALGGIGPDARVAVPALAHALTDRDWRMRNEAATALGRIGPGAAAAIPMLVRLACDESDYGAGQQAAVALARIGPRLCL